MSKRKVDFEVVREIGVKMANVEVSTAWGAPALKVNGKLMACVPTHRSAEPDSLLVRVSFDDRAELLGAAPEAYYVTEHYVGYTAVLVRLPCVTRDILQDLLGMAHRFVTATEGRRCPRRRGRKSA